MFTITISSEAEQQLDAIYENRKIYNGRNFTQQFINWNSEFHRYVNSKTISLFHLEEYGGYNIGNIGLCEYQCVRTQNAIVFNIVKFSFSKLPYLIEGVLNKKQCHHEFSIPNKIVITESYIRQMVRETLRRYLQL